MQYIVHWDLALHRDLTSLKLIGQKKTSMQYLY